ncbi:MAG: fimbrillin family protein [Bacteroidales bacterium]|nr:fimbrillin family protein [Bacteroidales bacterium]
MHRGIYWCGKHHATPDESDTKIPIDFSAISNTAEVKSTTPLSSIHDDFGVWGIARNSSQPYDYILWEQDRMTQVVESSNGYVPVEAAFWLSGYTYNFIAIAPFISGVDHLEVIGKTSSSNDAVTFDYSMADKYNKSSANYDLDFDLMGAVAQSTVDKAATHKSQQDLTFWHMLAQINIKLAFKDESGNATTGSAELRLQNVDQDASYRITSLASTDSQNPDKVSLEVNCTNTSKTYTVNPLVFDGTNDNRNSSAPAVNTWTWTLNIVPQNIEDFRLTLDFNIGGDEFRNYEINLFPSSTTPKEYGYNQQYNWNITLTPKYVRFEEPQVTPWQSGTEIPGVEIQ